MMRISGEAIVVCALLLLPAVAGAQGRCKDGEREDPDTGKCVKPPKPAGERGGRDKDRDRGKQEESDVEDKAILERNVCEDRCAAQQLTCREDRGKCDQTHALCMDECDKQYLIRLPNKRRREVLKEREEARKRAEDEARQKAENEARQKAEQQEAAAKAAQVQRAREGYDAARARAEKADEAARAGCQAAQRMKLAPLPCASQSAAEALARAKAAYDEAKAAPSSLAAQQAAEKTWHAANEVDRSIQAAITTSRPAIDALEAQNARDRAEADRKARAEETQRRAAESERRRLQAARDAEIAREQAWKHRREHDAQKRKLGWVVVGAGGAAILAGSIFAYLEQGKYNDVQNGNVASPSAARDAISTAHLYDKIAIGGWIAGGGAVLVGLPIIFTHRDPGEYRGGVSISAGPRGAALTYAGTW
jgi:hypothetical protein